MSMYNVTLHMGGFSMEVLKEGWLGFPIAYVFAMCCDWFLVSGLAKKFAFTYLVKPEDSVLKKVICVSCSMVVPMVLIMSMYGAVEGCVRSGAWSQLLMIWMTNIPKNFIMALPFQLIVAGPYWRDTAQNPGKWYLLTPLSRIFYLREQRAKVHACMRPWRLPR